jgi:hypothetical protein
LRFATDGWNIWSQGIDNIGCTMEDSISVVLLFGGGILIHFMVSLADLVLDLDKAIWICTEYREDSVNLKIMMQIRILA